MSQLTETQQKLEQQMRMTMDLLNEIKKKLAGGDLAGLSDAFHTFSAEPDKAELQQEAQWELKKAMTYLEEMDVWTSAFLLANQKCASRPVSNLSAPCVSSERNATMHTLRARACILMPSTHDVKNPSASSVRALALRQPHTALTLSLDAANIVAADMVGQ